MKLNNASGTVTLTINDRDFNIPFYRELEDGMLILNGKEEHGDKSFDVYVKEEDCKDVIECFKNKLNK